MNPLDNNSHSLSVDDLENMGNSLLGYKLMIRCPEATYVGVLQELLSDFRQLMLQQVIVVTSSKQKPRPGAMVIFYRDIISITRVGCDADSRKRVLKDIYGKSLKSRATERVLPPSASDDEKDELPFDLGDSKPEETEGKTRVHDELLSEASYFVIDSFGEDFEQFRLLCQREQVFAVFACGSKLGRLGALAWLCVEARDCVFLLDWPKFHDEKRLFQCLAEDFLADPDKVKVIHDARKLEDFLCHRFDIKMANVFDAQAADVYIRGRNVKSLNELPYLVNNLPYLIVQYLKTPKASVLKLFPPVENECLWFDRPLCSSLMVRLVNSVCHLKKLRDAMFKIINQDLNEIMDVFRAAYRSSQSAPIHFDDDLIPQDVLQMYLQANQTSLYADAISYS